MWEETGEPRENPRLSAKCDELKCSIQGSNGHDLSGGRTSLSLRRLIWPLLRQRLIAGIYRPPSTNSDYDNKIEKAIEEAQFLILEAIILDDIQDLISSKKKNTIAMALLNRLEILI